MKSKWYMAAAAIVVLAVVMLGFYWQEGRCMPVYIPSGAYPYIETSPSAVATSTTRTWATWAKFDTDAGEQAIIYDYDEALDQNAWTLKLDASNYFQFKFVRTTGAGVWHYASALTDGVWYHLAVSYDSGTATNDPVLYVNGAAVAVTEVYSPTGSLYTETDDTLYFGGDNCKLTIADNRIYNRILPAAEVAEMYNAKSYDSVPRGLVMQARMYGAAGVALDNTTLGTANYMRDYISGAAIIPGGSPILRADNLLQCNP